MVGLVGRYRHRHTYLYQSKAGQCSQCKSSDTNTVWSSNDAGGIIGAWACPGVYLPATVALVFGAPHFPDAHGSKLGGDYLSVRACTLGMHFHSQRASMVELSKLTHRVCDNLHALHTVIDHKPAFCLCTCDRWWKLCTRCAITPIAASKESSAVVGSAYSTPFLEQVL